MAGSGPGHAQPAVTTLITAPNGDIFVSDGHSGQSPDPPPGSTGRILKFDKDGNVHQGAWGRDRLSARVSLTHAALSMEFDSQGRLYRRRPRQPPHPDLRPGWTVSRRVAWHHGQRDLYH